MNNNSKFRWVLGAALCAACGLLQAGPAAESSERPPLAVVQTIGQRVQIEIPAQLTYPTAARDLKLEGRAVVQAVVGPDGRATQVRISNSSGSRYLDQAALGVVRRSHFLVLDAHESLAVNVPIEFDFPNISVVD